MEFDRRLEAVADCPVIPHTKQKDDDVVGGIIFSPFPSITASSNEVLAHEVCHALAGKQDYDIFNTMVQATDNNVLFKFISNILLDWYHEIKNEMYAPVVAEGVGNVRKIAAGLNHRERFKGYPEIIHLMDLYIHRNERPEDVGIHNAHDVMYVAKKIHNVMKKMPTNKMKMLVDSIFISPGQAGPKGIIGKWNKSLAKRDISGAGSATYGQVPLKSNFYMTTVSKYKSIIETLSEMWTRNKYDWVRKHFGEIDWKNLINMYIGEKLQLPVFLILSKIVLAKNVHLCIDRSGSTSWDFRGKYPDGIKYPIMETAIIITESLRMNNVPISILDVGVTDSVINKIDQPIDISWFTPMAEGGTPLGEVCSGIKEKSPDSILIIITDGGPANFDTLLSAIHKFPGENITFVIGDSYRSYRSVIQNAVPVEPHTMLKELKSFIEKGGNV